MNLIKLSDFLKYVWPFYIIMHERVNFQINLNKIT